jgi:hypothetical protein
MIGSSGHRVIGDWRLVIEAWVHLLIGFSGHSVIGDWRWRFSMSAKRFTF